MAESGKQPDDEGGAPPRAPDERARARAYLDLWEQHLVELALAGPRPGPPRHGAR